MDVEKALRELYEEKYRLDAIIEKLEIEQSASVHEVSGPRKRGRKFMTPEEREIVSRRMVVYWAERKSATA